MEEEGEEEEYVGEDGGTVIGGRPQMMRARSCWCSGRSAWMSGTACDQISRKEMKAGGQLSSDRSIWGAGWPPLCFAFLRGRGTDGGLVVHRSAAK